MAPRVCLAISAYRSDASVIRLLESAMALPSPAFEKVLVVDSLGSGEIAGAIALRGWSERVEYRTFPTNLGSAGNLSQRLLIPTQQGFDFVYAINHDGLLDSQIIKRLLEEAERVKRVGAVYPLRRYTRRGGGYDLTGLSRLPIPARISMTKPTEPILDAYWGSSNGALYSTQPLREGLRILAELWLGWEDLAWGWSLESAGFEQLLVTSAVLDDDYEYAERKIGPVRKALSEKPNWYSYYVSRNLIIAARETHQGLPTAAAVAARTLMEFGFTLVARADKVAKLKLLLRGVVDGIRGRSGKGPVP